MADYMRPPYTVDLSDSIADDESDCWVIDNDRGSVAEMTCPAYYAEATARFLARAGNAHDTMAQEIGFAIANGAKWTLEDWQNWITNHATPALALANKESESE